MLAGCIKHYLPFTDGEIEDLKRRIGDTVMQIKQDSMFVSDD